MPITASITSDTATAHLAGGAGLPAHLLLSRPADWRWGQDGERSPWYPSLRLWRQQAAEELPLLLTYAQGDGLYGLDNVEIVAGIELVSADAGPRPSAGLLHVFPNPARELLYVQLPPEAQQLWVYDLAGRELLSEAVSGEAHRSLRRTGWPAGSYCLVVRGKNGQRWWAQLSLLPEK
jgi:hypothetical protein